MSIGPKDIIDQKLVQMYANTQTNNFDTASKVDPDQIMRNMSLLALNNKAFVEIRKNMRAKKIA